MKNHLGLTMTREEELARIEKKCFSKRRYPRETDARMMVQKREESGSEKLAVYQCDICDGWHLTKTLFFRKNPDENRLHKAP